MDVSAESLLGCGVVIITVGVVVGSTVGSEVGVIVGCMVGVDVGVEVGAIDGASVMVSSRYLCCESFWPRRWTAKVVDGVMKGAVARARIRALNFILLFVFFDFLLVCLFWDFVFVRSCCLSGFRIPEKGFERFFFLN